MLTHFKHNLIKKSIPRHVLTIEFQLYFKSQTMSEMHYDIKRDHTNGF